ncbi:MAG: hypothetical protein QXV35_07610 [Archaeoglobaceae archaeon]
MKVKLAGSVILLFIAATIVAAVAAQQETKISFFGDLETIEKAVKLDVTFYASGSTVFINSSRYMEPIYYIRVVSPEAYYYNGTIFLNSTSFSLEFPIGWEKMVKLYSNGACFNDGKLTSSHIYVTSASSSASSTKIVPSVLKDCEYCMQVIFYKTTTSTGDKKSYTFIEYVFDSCEPESYDFVQLATYGNITQMPMKLVFR